MKRARSIFGIGVVLSFAGWLSYPHWNSALTSSPSPAGVSAEFRRFREEGNRLFFAHRYAEALPVYQECYQRALQAGETASALRCLHNQGNCRFAMAQYQAAAASYLEARRLARSIPDLEVLGAVAMNLSAIYLQMGDVKSAALAAEEGIRDLQDYRKIGFRAQLLAQLGNAQGWMGQFDEAQSNLHAAVREAEAAGDLGTLALALDYAGNHSLRRGELTDAEEAFLRAFLVRKLRQRQGLHYSYANIGRLRLAQGDAQPAEELLNRAIEETKSAPSLVQVWSLYHGRGKARAAQGKDLEALADFRTAVDLARRWRIEAVASDSLRIHTDAGLHEVYGSYIQMGNRLAITGGRPELARATFWVAEEHRAASLRERWGTPAAQRARLPGDYWAVLAELQQAEVAVLRNPGAEVAGRRARLRLRLAEMEAQAGMPHKDETEDAPADLSRRIQQRLRPWEAVMSFDFEREQSYLWAVTRESMSLHALAGKGELAELIARFRESVRRNDASAAAAGRELYGKLFGQLPANVTRKEHWILVLDDVLFEAPLAALVTSEGRYLAQAHSLLTVPSAAALLEGNGNADAWEGLFVGAGDAIYNLADARWVKERRHRRGGLSRDGLLELPRLAASGQEIRECARRWKGSETVLLEGASASRERLAQLLARRPAVLHMAVHVVAAPAEADSAVIVLSLRSAEESEVLTSTEIPLLGAARLVVLSGCSSGAGAAIPGAGLIGLTRAWLAGGAERVVGSLWPTPDDAGELFLAFYGYLGKDSREAAEALRRAQLEMLGHGDWRSQARYWAAYFVTGKG